MTAVLTPDRATLMLLRADEVPAVPESQHAGRRHAISCSTCERSHGSELVDARTGAALPRHVHVLRLARPSG